jgi:glycosyltransferase involved in cell wall biosynthesis
VKKALFVATVVKKHINVFHLPYLKWLKENGYSVDVCAKNDYDRLEDCNIPYCDNHYNYQFSRFPLTIKNFFILIKMRKLLNDNNYDIIHCHTPVGGLITRLASRKIDSEKLIYTAHGFHFFKGASIFNWIIYYPIEYLLSFKTKVLIVINEEDYKVANKMKYKKVIKVDGVGLTNKNQISFADKNLNENSFKHSMENVVNLCSVGELSKRKNHLKVIKILNKLNFNYSYTICGDGRLKKKLSNIIDNNNLNVHLLGFRNDVEEVLNQCDIYISSSSQEGLPVSVMEAMKSSLPVIASNIRGNRDLIDSNGGILVSNENDYIKALNFLANNIEERSKMGVYNHNKVKKYNIAEVIEKVTEIYRGI